MLFYIFLKYGNLIFHLLWRMLMKFRKLLQSFRETEIDQRSSHAHGEPLHEDENAPCRKSPREKLKDPHKQSVVVCTNENFVGLLKTKKN